MVVRDTDGTVKAFRNACRHRGTRLQAAKGIQDSPALHLADALRISRGTVSESAIKPVIDGGKAVQLACFRFV